MQLRTYWFGQAPVGAKVRQQPKLFPRIPPHSWVGVSRTYHEILFYSPLPN